MDILLEPDGKKIDHASHMFTKKNNPSTTDEVQILRIEPDILDSSGQIFWKLKSYNGEHAILMQGNSQHELAQVLWMTSLFVIWALASCPKGSNIQRYQDRGCRCFY